MTKTLECSSRGDKRFSAFYAKITYPQGYKKQSIENVYQLAKRFGNVVPVHWKDSKGKIPTHFNMCGVDMPVELLSSFYHYLWYVYLQENPELAAYIQQFDQFTDMFKGNALNCQADSIHLYKQDNGYTLYWQHVKPLMDEYNKRIQKRTSV